MLSYRKGLNLQAYISYRISSPSVIWIMHFHTDNTCITPSSYGAKVAITQFGYNNPVWFRIGITLFQNDDDDSELGRSYRMFNNLKARTPICSLISLRADPIVS